MVIPGSFATESGNASGRQKNGLLGMRLALILCRAWMCIVADPGSSILEGPEP